MSKKSGKRYTFVSEPDVASILEDRKAGGISYDFTANSAIRKAYGSTTKATHVSKVKTKAGNSGAS